MDDAPPVSRELRILGIPHRVHRHAAPVTSLEQAARERGQHPQQVVRSIVFRLGEDRFIMVLAAGPGQISWKRLRQHVGQTRLTLATAAEVLRVTGYRIGTVSPIGLRQPLRILLDRGVLAVAEVSLGAGVPNTGIILTSEDLLRAIPGAEMVDLLELP
jgi:prolyl-tRNA editing enzyme YbaK/EbsC (Cys-tRNA(Pro) deacylase)